MSGTSSRTSSSTSAFGNALVHVAGAGLEQQRVADPQGDVEKGVGEHDHPLFVAVAEHQRTFAVFEDLLEHHDFALALELEGAHDVECLVQHDFLALAEVGDLDGRAHGDAQLAAAGEDVDRSVVVPAEEDAVARRRLGQPVDLFAQGDDLFAGLFEGADESLVLPGHAGQGGLGVGEPLLEHAHAAGRLGELAAQRRDLLFEETELALKLRGVVTTVRARAACLAIARIVTTSHEPHLLAVLHLDPTVGADQAAFTFRVETRATLGGCSSLRLLAVPHRQARARHGHPRYRRL